MARWLTLVILSATTSACGLAGTAATGAVGGVSSVEEARQAKQTEARVQQQLDDAQKQATAQRDTAERESQ